MKLHELEYTEGARRASFRVGRGIGTGNGKTSGKGQKVKTLEAVAEHVSASKVVKTHYSVVYQKEASTILLVSNSQLLTSRI